MEFDTAKSILLFLFLFLPGFVSLRIWSLFYRSGKQEPTVMLYDCAFFSVMNLALLSPIVIPMLLYGWYMSKPILTVFFVLVYCLVAPISWAFLWRYLRNKEYLHKFIQLPHATAWDYFFDQRRTCFMLIHLQDDNMVGGYYGKNSFASTSPDEQNVYLERVYKVTVDGKFGDEIPDTFGLLISQENIKYIECFYEEA